jgi:hypothetical protein
VPSKNHGEKTKQGAFQHCAEKSDGSSPAVRPKIKNRTALNSSKPKETAAVMKNEKTVPRFSLRRNKKERKSALPNFLRKGRPATEKQQLRCRLPGVYIHSLSTQPEGDVGNLFHQKQQHHYDQKNCRSAQCVFSFLQKAGTRFPL